MPSPSPQAEPHTAIVSEGLTLCALRQAGVLLAFGGYNGRYHNTVQALRPGAALP